MGKFTAGPWKTDYNNDVGPNDEYFWEWVEIVDDKYNVIAKVACGSRITDTDKANANLIASAPDMYKKLKEVVEELERNYDYSAAHGEQRAIESPFSGAGRLINDINDIIRKVEG